MTPGSSALQALQSDETSQAWRNSENDRKIAKIHEAKSPLSKLVELAMNGEAVIIAEASQAAIRTAVGLVGGGVALYSS